MRRLLASLAVFTAMPAEAQVAEPEQAKPYTLEEAVDALVMRDVTVVEVRGRCVKDTSFPLIGRYQPNRAGRQALHAAGLSDEQIGKYLNAGCQFLPAFTVNLASGLSIIGTDTKVFDFVAKRWIGEFSSDAPNNPTIQRENIRAHEHGHVYFNSENVPDVFNASTAAKEMAAKNPGMHSLPAWINEHDYRPASPFDELVGDAFMACDAAANGRDPNQIDILMNWRESAPGLSPVYRNGDVLTPQFISVLQAACQPLGPKPRGEVTMATTLRTLLQGPLDYLLK